MRILLADPDLQTGALLRAVLRARGHELVQCPDEASTRAALIGEKYELVVLDLGMSAAAPLDPIEPLTHLPRRVRPEIILTSVEGERSDVVRRSMRSLKGTSYLRKPFSILDLTDRMKAIQAAKQRAPARPTASPPPLLRTLPSIALAPPRTVTREQNRRSLYRVDGGVAQDLFAHLHDGRGRRLAVDLEDINSGGAGVLIPDRRGAKFTAGDEVRLEFNSPKLRDAMEVPGSVCRVQLVDDRAVRLGVAFNTWMDRRRTLDARLRSLFNEREAFRVEPPRLDELEVEVELGGHRLRTSTHIRDISVLGIGLWTPPRVRDVLKLDTNLSLRFRLPNHQMSLSLDGRVRHIMGPFDAQGYSVGVELIIDSTRNPDEFRTIQDYVIKRQLELRRKKKQG